MMKTVQWILFYWMAISFILPGCTDLSDEMALATEYTSGDVTVHVVDVGQALCTITETPDAHYMIYDAGYWKGEGCLNAALNLVQTDTIDLLVLSHTDADHLGDAAAILKAFTVKQIIRTGIVRETSTWRAVDAAVAEAVDAGAIETNLQWDNLAPGTAFNLGAATVTVVAGWGNPNWNGLSDAERFNAASIVVKLSYQGHSVLFTGDTVGRHVDDANNICIAAEKAMVDNRAVMPLNAEVLIVPHHGADNAGSPAFIQAVSPAFAVVSAGNDYAHPRAVAMQRYLDYGLPAENIFRTDRGDDEGDLEWDWDRIVGCVDPDGDDSIEIVLPATGNVSVSYGTGGSLCTTAEN